MSIIRLGGVVPNYVNVSPEYVITPGNILLVGNDGPHANKGLAANSTTHGNGDSDSDIDATAL